MEQTGQPISRVDHDAEVLRDWVIPEYTQHERSTGWFVGASIVGLLLLVLSFWTPNWIFDRPNFLFAVLVVLTAFIVVFRHYSEPPLLAIVLYADGVGIGERFYSYRELGSFWIIYEPPKVKMLYFHFTSGWRPRLPIPLEDENPVEIRQILEKYLREDLEREGEPTSDALSRILRI